MKHTKRKLAIIADDLTGANDCGVHFSENGFDTTVNLNFNKGLNNYSEVLVVDADTRELDKNQASSIIKKAFHQIKDAGYSILLKKIDSRSEEHTSELQSRGHLVCRLLLEKNRPTPQM